MEVEVNSVFYNGFHDYSEKVLAEQEAASIALSFLSNGHSPLIDIPTPNYIGALYQYCQQHGLSAPEFNSTQSESDRKWTAEGMYDYLIQTTAISFTPS